MAENHVCRAKNIAKSPLRAPLPQKTLILDPTQYLEPELPCQWPDTDIFYKIKKVRNAQMARIFQGLPSKFFPQLKETIFVD
jgi:hypothetical protein